MSSPFPLRTLILATGLSALLAGAASAQDGAPAAPAAAAKEAPPAAPAPETAAPAAPATHTAPAKAAKTSKAASPRSAAAVPASIAGPTAVVITVGPNKIRRNQIDHLVEAMTKASPSPRVLDDREKNAMAAMIATNLIGQELLELEAKQLAIVAPEKEVDSMYRALRQNFPDEATWKKVLKEGGNTEKTFRDKLVRQIKADKILNKQVPQVERPTNKEIIDYFAANKAKFPVNDSLRAAQILFLAGKDVKAEDVARKKADIEKVRAELAKDSADPDRLLARFMVAARQVSEGPEKKDGGDLQRFHPNDFSPELKKQLAGLRVGQMSPVFKTPLGWHIVLLTEKYDGKPDSYRYLIARALATEKATFAGKSLRKYLQGLAGKYKVNYLESAYRDTSPTGVYNL
jgi:peptidyl-prolyl cis-trans isomerase SurA